MGDVRFEVLGEVRAWVGDEAVDLGPARQRAVLAALVVDAGQTVMLDQLVERVWGEHALAAVSSTVRSYLSRLRTLFGDATGFGIVRQTGGYVARIDPSTVDLNRFAGLLAVRRSTDEDRAEENYRRALGLWRDEAFAGLDSQWFAARRHALGTTRHTATLDRLDLRLRRGWTRGGLARAGRTRGREPVRRAAGRATDGGAVPLRSAGRGPGAIRAGALGADRRVGRGSGCSPDGSVNSTR